MSNEIKKEKENAFEDWLDMTKKSWTYKRLSEKERNWFLKLFSTAKTASSSPIIGSYEKRFEVLNWMYHSFLCGLGYNENPVTWRDEEVVS